MRRKLAELLPIFRSEQQALLLAALFLHPDQELSMTELARRAGVPLSTIQREVTRLVRSGILRDRVVGRSHLLSANTDSRLARPLTDLLAVTYGPVAVLDDEFGAVDGVDLLLIYGSWAARYAGEAGSPPRDVDVLVVGTPSRTAVYDAAERAGQRLGLPVNPIVSSPRRWAASGDALIQQIRASPTVIVIDRSDRSGRAEV